MDTGKMIKIKKINNVPFTVVDGNYVKVSEHGEYLFNLSADKNNDRYRNKLIISIQVGGNLHTFDLFDCFQTKYISFYFNSIYFTNAEIKHASEIFHFDIIFNPIYPDLINGALISINEEYSDIDALVLTYSGKYVLLIYACTRTKPCRCAADDMPDTYYIHGIWEVELSEDMKQAIFGQNNQPSNHINQ